MGTITGSEMDPFEEEKYYTITVQYDFKVKASPIERKHRSVRSPAEPGLRSEASRGR